jgi:hydrogenase-4 component F
VTETATLIAFAVPALPLVGGLVIQFAPSPRSQDWVNRVSAVVTAAVAFGAAALALAGGGQGGDSNWISLDALAGPFLAVIALVGLCSALVSPAYLRTSHRSFFHPSRARAWYYLCFYIFWAALLAIPLAGSLGMAWIIIEATTGVSALLVAYNGRPRALEAGWKYLMLTTAGLTVALLGIVVLYAALPERTAGLSGLSWRGLAAAAPAMPGRATLFGFLLLFCGLATKVGWAPVHNWLPDAHSEAPPPISALLSAALLPTVMLVAWRAQKALEPAIGVRISHDVFLAFGLVSLAVAVPFLWRPLAWKRLLAYSSLEHMGVLALGIGFGNPLAIAGVVLHLAGHAVAKSLGFYAATPLFDLRPSARRHPARGLLQENSALAAGMSLSLGSLSGLPP